jgi:DNA adenine methylase
LKKLNRVKRQPYYTPLRYPGGKGKLANYVKIISEENNLMGGHYSEVYAGGAGVALKLLLEGYFDTISINDIDPGIYAFWSSVLNENAALCELIYNTPVDISTWRHQKFVLANHKEHTNLQVGFATFFLNRCNRSGILKGGVIGGVNQDGKWKLDVRYNKMDLIRRIELIGDFNDRIFLFGLDAMDFIIHHHKTYDRKSLLYLDPPYYKKGKGLYRNFYDHNDHLKISKLIKGLDKVNWFITYDNVDQIKEMYSEFRTLEYSLSYTAQNKTVGSEILIFSDQLEIPDVTNPSKVKVA